MLRLLSFALLAGLLVAAPPPTRDAHTAGYVAATDLPDGANAPPTADGNFVLGPTHASAPEMTVQPDVPHGTVSTFTMASADSKIYPGIAREPNTFGTPDPKDPAKLIVTTSHPAAYTRRVSVYVPKQYVAGTAAPFIVGADGPDPALFTVLDNLIAQHRVPAMIAISISNGSGDAQGSQRGLEYDTMSGLYAEFVEKEVLPLVESKYNVKLTKDPEGRATMGGSSGGSCALIMAWYHPDLYHRVLTYSGTYVNQQWPPDARTPHGAWEFHEHLIPNSPAKPIRLWMEVGDRDLLNPNVMPDNMHDWVLANEKMAQVLAAKGYHYQFVFARNAGHTDRAVKQQTLAEALEYVWQGYATAATDAGLERFRATFKELVETNTTLSAGDCTLAAQRMGARLKAAGYPEQDVRVFVPEGHPKEGGLLAVLHGSDPQAKAILMLGHVDVVEAKREDWTRDPFTLMEEGGYFYARGTSDMKAQDAIWVDNMVRFREEGLRPKHSVKLALTCGEETNSALNGAGWLAAHERDAIDAEFALNEGVGGDLDAQGKRVALGILAAEKTSQNFVLEATNPGGHSSRPVPENAIYHLIRAVERISRYEFPVQLDDANRAYFTAMSKIVKGEKGAAMAAVVRNPADAAAVAELDQDRSWHSMLRTTCVATMLSAGHATNALPQRARANINCRLFPGVARETVRAKLVELAADPGVSVTIPEVRGPLASPAPLTPRILKPIVKLADEMWPGVPLVPTLEPGASDAQFLNPVGIPTYGITGLFEDADGGNIHGLNERIRVQSVYDGRAFLYRLVKAYAE